MFSKFTRRQFLSASAAAALTVPTFIPRSVFADGRRPGANERIGLAAIGVGRQGDYVLNEMMKDQRVNGVCICDLWKKRAAEMAEKHKFKESCQDYRTVLDRKDVDAIVTATPEHWRSLICVNAALAGKHLYVEKPITLTIEDGKQMRKAARKTGIAFQCGSMQRSYLKNYLASRFIREGELGKITEVLVANYESPWLNDLPAEPVPEGLDWDTWCGPTEPVPYNIQLYVPRGKPGWLSFRPYSGGEMTGWGTHGFDQVQSALGLDDTGPVEIFVEGEKLSPPTYKEATDKKIGDEQCSSPRLSYRYANGITVRLSIDAAWNSGVRGGGVFVGEKGKLEVIRNKMTSDPPELAEEYLKKHADLKIPTHYVDWINCIYSDEKPIGDIETGIRTASICHVLNIARYLGRNLKWDPGKEEFVDDDEANTWLRRKHRKGFELPVI